MADINLFVFSNSILATKEYQEDLSEYPPPFVNKGISQHVDCILHANAMNLNWMQLTKKQQYDYYFYSIRKMKRKYSSWGKKANNDKIDLIMKYHNWSYRRALDCEDLFNDEQIEKMKVELDIGG